MSMWEKTILVIDDDQQILNLVETLFQQEGARVITSLDPEAALRLLYRHQPDLVVVDLMMPVMNGLELARRIRELSAVPIMMLTAVNSDQETVRALRIGCDDYVTKPFMPNVLIARAKVLLRRSEAEEEPDAAFAYDDGYLMIDLHGQRVQVEGQTLRLTPTEFELLALLVRRAGKVCTFAQIMSQLWPDGVGGSEAAVHTYVWQLRQKLERNPAQPEYLVGLRARGYRFDRATIRAG